MSIVVTRAATVVDDANARVVALRETFAREHVVRLPGFFDDALLDEWRARLEHAAFSPRVEGGVEIELTLEEPAPLALAMVTLNDPALFTAIDRISGCGLIGCFSGRVYRRHTNANGGHSYPWHSDVVHDRLVGLSVNLSDAPFEGGVLELRRRRSKRILARVENPTPGDAVLFRISRELEHQVTPVTSQAPRVVLAGWFRRSPNFWARVCVSS